MTKVDRFLDFVGSMVAQNIDLRSSQPGWLPGGLPPEFALKREEIERLLRSPEELSVLAQDRLSLPGFLNDEAALIEALEEGSSVCVGALQRRRWELAHMREACNSLAHVSGVSATFGALHVTPATRWGSGEHADIGWTLVCQLLGTKVWYLEAPQESSMSDFLASRSPDDYVNGGHSARHYKTLHSGDVLFVPSAWRHAAFAGKERSVHISYGGPYPGTDLGPITLKISRRASSF